MFWPDNNNYVAYPCQICHVTAGWVTDNHQNTAYHNHSSNYAYLCPPCQIEADEYWDSMWQEYYSSVR